jgi:ectoine hydroxylase-related dioxygenase (phytanoyl-CoA dioxygenase family)
MDYFKIVTPGSKAVNANPLRPITGEEVRQFVTDGVICLGGLFDRDWCERMYAAAIRHMESGAGRVREAKPAGGKGRFYSCVYMSDTDPDFRAFREVSPAPAIAARLMQVDRVRFYYDQLFIKEPGTTAPTPWHNDLPFWPFRGSDLVSIWIALTPVTKASSGVEYVAGSHRWGRMFRAVTPDYDPRFMDPAMPECPDYGADGGEPAIRAVSWDMQPGDVLCHHPLTVHGAAGNASATQRRVGLSIRYLGTDVQWDPRPHTMKLNIDPGVRTGDYPADDTAFPVVWESGRGHVALAG